MKKPRNQQTLAEQALMYNAQARKMESTCSHSSVGETDSYEGR